MYYIIYIIYSIFNIESKLSKLSSKVGGQKKDIFRHARPEKKCTSTYLLSGNY